ncbi:AraC family transcriptional regulator [bacterium]|nr:AraC family transcriptional regulator [bacterium]
MSNDGVRIAALEKRLLCCLAAGRGVDPIVQQAMWQIEQAQGTLSIRDLLTDVGVSERKLQRLFKQSCGVSPKMFSQLTRFWLTLQLLDQRASWSEIVMRARYHDQSHFIREFKTFTTMTPSAYTLYPQQLRLTDADSTMVNDDHNGGGKDPLSLIHLVR